MKTAIIIDDEQASIDALLWELEELSDQIQVLKTFTNPEEALLIIDKINPEVIFLDINMPVMDGFEFLKQLASQHSIIFTTAHDDYAIEAFKVNAIDYLLKPVGADDIQIALDKVLHQSKSVDEIVDALHTAFSNSAKKNRISIPTSQGLEFVEVSTIMRCEAEGNYSQLYFNNSTKLLVSKTLKYIEDLIQSEEFIRVHNSHLVNINFVRRYNRGKGGSIELTDGTTIAVSKSKKDDFLKGM